ncbi:hypothetical protein [Microscilla marina]|uniref:Uncharacterized protein n=1 Tax=Microscilla marina ATCC 23134 TaxID=313606 RepID=A1ZU19_MICM2|nr:hypothetical protein [Microscilla marina]EAY26132.1 hypothetical protein M23134_06005 [Microscilla marina ATCC 23134]
MDAQVLNTMIAYQAIARTEKIYKQLSHEQRQIIDDQIIEGSHTPGEWINLIAKIVQYDAMADEARQFKIDRPIPSRDALLMIGGVVAGVFLLAFQVWAWVAMVLPLYWLLVFAYFLLPVGKKVLRKEAKQRAMARKYAHLLFDYSDLPNHFRKFILPLIRELATMMNSNDKLELHVNLGPKKQAIHRTEREDEPSNEAYDAPESYVYENSEFYNYPLMNIRARLKDGSYLNFNIEDMIRNRRYIRRVFVEDDQNEEIWKGTMRISYHLQVLLRKSLYDLASKHAHKSSNFMVDDVDKTVLDLRARDNAFLLSYVDGGDTHILNIQASTVTKLQRYYYFGDFEVDQELYYIPDIDFLKRLLRIIKHQVKPIKNVADNT